jgi:P27 family predicted phage terminase small subunit
MGRNPTPTALKKARNNPGHRPLNEREPKPDLGEPPMPKWLSKLARKYWKNIAPFLLKMKVLCKVDGEALASYCEACANLQRAQDEIELNGVLITIYETGDDGKPLKDEHGRRIVLDVKTNPAVTIADKAMKMKRALGGDFGLSPVSRAKLKTEDGGESEDPMAAFLQRRKSTSTVTQ